MPLARFYCCLIHSLCHASQYAFAMACLSPYTARKIRQASPNQDIISSSSDLSEEKDVQNQTCTLHPFRKTVSPSSEFSNVGTIPLIRDPDHTHRYNMSAQQRSVKQRSEDKPAQSHRPIPKSHTSSVRAEAGSNCQSGVERPKPSAQGPSDMSYSMNRWLEQKPSEEPWHGLRR
jgi:hypothetical protein